MDIFTINLKRCYCRAEISCDICELKYHETFFFLSRHSPFKGQLPVDTNLEMFDFVMDVDCLNASLVLTSERWLDSVSLVRGAGSGPGKGGRV